MKTLAIPAWYLLSVLAGLPGPILVWGSETPGRGYVVILLGLLLLPALGRFVLGLPIDHVVNGIIVYAMITAVTWIAYVIIIVNNFS